MTELVRDQAAVPRVAANTSYDEIADLLAEHGAVIVTGLFDAEVVAAVNAELDEAAAAAGDRDAPMYVAMLDGFHGEGTTHVTALAAKSRTFATQVMAHPIYRAMADRFLTWSVLEGAGLPRDGCWNLNLAHLIIRGPGSSDQMLHRDEDIWMEVPYPRRGVLLLASMIAFVDFTAENGATRLIPGSHRWPEAAQPVTTRARQPQEDEVVFAEMPAGSAVLYLGTTVHGGSANRTEATMRRGAHLSFALGWLRTEENNYLAVPPAVARTLPQECQEILGYRSTGLLGAVDLRNPIDLLAEGKL